MIGRIAPLVSCLLLQACSPSLNWREVRLGDLSTVLPCKPDTASRSVELQGQTLTMDMAGCEVDGALFAISRLVADDPAQAPLLMAALRQVSLTNVHAHAVHPSANSGDAQTSFDLLVEGQGGDGAPLQARFKWLLEGAQIYQLAVYGQPLRPEQTESVLRELRLR